MKKIINFHLYYLLNKVTIFVFSFIILLSLLSDITNFISITEITSKNEYNEIYFTTSFFMIKTLVIFLAIFLYAYTNLSVQEQYSYLILTSNVTRVKYLFSKLLTLMIFLFLFILIEFTIFCVVGIIGYPYFYIKKYYVSFLSLFLIANYYGYLSLLIVKLLDNIFAIMVPFILYQIGVVLNQNKHNKKFLKIYNIFWPSFSENGYDGTNTNLYIIIASIIVIGIILFLYEKLDWK